MNVTFGVSHLPGKFLKGGSLKKRKHSMVYVPILKTIQHLLMNDVVVTEVSMNTLPYKNLFHYLPC